MARRDSGKKIAKLANDQRSDKSRGRRTHASRSTQGRLEPIRRRGRDNTPIDQTAIGATDGATKKNRKISDSKHSQALHEVTMTIREEIWPSERPVLFRPDRLRYVRKMIKPDGCVFCRAAESGPSVESLLLFRSENLIVVLNKYPYNNGHLLILPRRHVGEFTQLTDVELFEINLVLKRALKALNEAYSPSGFNVGLNLGPAAGAGIPEHLHYHVIPRWTGDTNFFPLIAETKVVVETLEQTFGRLLPYFEGS